MILNGLGRGFWMRQTLESVDSVQQIAFPNVVGRTQSAEGLNSSKVCPPSRKGKLLLLAAIERDSNFFLSSGLNWNYCLSRVPSLLTTGFRMSASTNA